MHALRAGALPALVLSFVLALTGVALGHARGTVMAGESVILCSGTGVVVVSLDAQGNPVGPPHVCPDMALGLIAGVAPPAPDLPARPGARVEAAVMAAMPVAPAQNARTARARGPPLAA